MNRQIPARGIVENLQLKTNDFIHEVMAYLQKKNKIEKTKGTKQNETPKQELLALTKNKLILTASSISSESPGLLSLVLTAIGFV